MMPVVQRAWQVGLIDGDDLYAYSKSKNLYRKAILTTAAKPTKPKPVT